MIEFADPYAALPPLFADRDGRELSDFVRGLEKVDDGGPPPSPTPSCRS